MTPSRSTTRPPWRATRVAAILAALLLLFTWGIPPVLQGLGDALIIEDAPERVDALVVLAFEPQRIEHAIALLKAGRARRAIVCFSPSFRHTFFTRAGVDPQTLCQSALASELASSPVELTFLEGCASTFEEAVAATAMLRHWGVRKAGLISAPYHMRRARWSFRKADTTGQIHWRCMPFPLEADGMKAVAWWRREKELVWVFTEWLKQLLYLWKY